MAIVYATRSDVEDVFGVVNVDKWADLDDDDDAGKITARITRAILVATARVDDFLRGGPYTIQFTAPIVVPIVDITAKFAGTWLYAARGVADFDEEIGKAQDRLQFVRAEAWKDLKNIRSGASVLDVTSDFKAPRVVKL